MFNAQRDHASYQIEGLNIATTQLTLVDGRLESPAKVESDSA
jgi:hypothetical protein